MSRQPKAGFEAQTIAANGASAGMVERVRDLAEANGETLSAAQRHFVIELAKGCNQSEAARRAGYSAATASSQASQLIRLPKVKRFYETLLARPIGAILPTREEHVASLAELRELAKDQKNLGAAVKAEELIGRVCGYYIERSENMDLSKIAQSLTPERQLELVRHALKRIEDLTGQKLQLPAQPSAGQSIMANAPAQTTQEPQECQE